MGRRLGKLRVTGASKIATKGMGMWTLDSFVCSESSAEIADFSRGLNVHRVLFRQPPQHLAGVGAPNVPKYPASSAQPHMLVSASLGGAWWV